MLSLNHKIFGSETAPPLLILHGLFGMLDNWQSIATRLSEHFRVYIIDQRNHGKSPWTDQHNYYELANDLLDFVQQHQIPPFYLIGHSMGGKTAMQFAVEHPALLRALVVADIAPKSYPSGEHDTVLYAFNKLPLATLNDRKTAEQWLEQHELSPSVAQFILKNLYRTTDNQFAWRCNVATLTAHYEQILQNSLYFYDTCSTKTLFLKGANSTRYIELPDDLSLIQHHFPNSELSIIANAGHWIHAEQPDQFFETVLHFFRGIG